MKKYVALALAILLLSGCAPHPEPSKIVLPPKETELSNPVPPEELPEVITPPEKLPEPVITTPPITLPTPQEPPKVEKVYKTGEYCKDSQLCTSGSKGAYFVDASESYNLGPMFLYREDGTLLWETEPGITLHSVDAWEDTLYVLAESSFVSMSTTGGSAQTLYNGVTHFTVGDGVVYCILNNKLSWFPVEKPQEVIPIWQDSDMERMKNYCPLPGGDLLLETATDTESHLYRYRLGGILEPVSTDLLPLYDGDDGFYSIQTIEDVPYLCHVDIDQQTVTPAYPLPEPFNTYSTFQNGMALAKEQAEDTSGMELYTLDLPTGKVTKLADYENRNDEYALYYMHIMESYIGKDYVYLRGKAYVNGLPIFTRLPLDGGQEEAFYHGQWMSAKEYRDTAYCLHDNVKSYTDHILLQIFQHYFLSHVGTFSQGEEISFDRAYSYGSTGGFYRLKPQGGTTVRSELRQNFDEIAWSAIVSSDIIDNYLLSKFPTTVDHTLISSYRKDGCYDLSGFQGGIPQNLTISDVVRAGNTITYTGTATMDQETTNYHITLEITDGEYRFLSVTT